MSRVHKYKVTVSVCLDIYADNKTSAIAAVEAELDNHFTSGYFSKPLSAVGEFIINGSKAKRINPTLLGKED